MKQISFTIIDPVGLHARPATVAVNTANKFMCDVRILYMERSVNMKSILGVMSLAVPSHSEVAVSCDGADEDAAIQAIEDVLRAQKVIA